MLRRVFGALERKWYQVRPIPQPIRVGRLGLGGSTSFLDMPLLRHPRLTVVAGYDPDPVKTKAYCDMYEAHRCTSEDELFETIDAVVIASPNKFHLPQIQKALKLGIDVFVEKPLTVTAQEAKKIKLGKQVLQVGHNYRYIPAVRKIKGLLDAGTYGKPTGFSFLSSSVTAASDLTGWRADPKQLPTGALHQLGVHLIDIAVYLFGSVSSVSASFSNVQTDKIYDKVFLDLACKSLSGRIGCSYSGRPQFGLQIDFESGSLTFNWDWGLRFNDKKISVPRGDSFALEFGAFAEAIASRTQPEVDLPVATHYMHVLDASLESFQKKKRINL